MAIFDLFKKNPPAKPAPEVKPAPVTPTAPEAKPAPAAPAAPIVRPAPAAPAPQRNPAPAPVSAPPSPPKPAQSAPARNQNTGYLPAWPRFGCTTQELLANTKFKVFIDASFVKSNRFDAFHSTWSSGRTGQYATRYYYIPAYEAEKLTPELQQKVKNSDCRIFSAANCDDCFAQLINKGLNWTILWLTDEAGLGIEAQNAAKKTGKVFLRWYGMDKEGKLCSLSSPTKAPAAPIIRPVTKLVTVAKADNPPAVVPARGAAVNTGSSRQQYLLREPVMADHASITYRTSDPNFFAKIYTAQALQLNIFENKAKHMVEKGLSIDGVCWPKDTLQDSAGRFVGILVPVSRGIQLSRSVLSGVSGLQLHFPTWDKRDLCVLARTILQKMQKLHQAGVLFGCINPASIYVVSQDTVYFVDADAWQMDGYPVLSRNMTFTPPELLGDGKRLHLFTMDEENYQVALMTFMLMLPGKYPYAKRKRTSEDESLRSMSFPFSIGGDLKRSQDAERPSGPWQIAWDHLPYNLCHQFYHTFHPEGNYAKPGSRRGLGVWLDLVANFEKVLATPEGAQSRQLFPATFRRDGKRTFVRCQICGREHPTFYFLRRIRIQGQTVDVWEKGYRVCLPCAVDKSNSPEAKFTCNGCHREFCYTNRTQIMHQIGKADYQWHNQRWCSDCKKRTVACSQCYKQVPINQIREFRDYRRNQTRSVCSECEKVLKNETYSYPVCKNCHRSFVITQGDAQYFLGKGLNLPTRCPSCRGR